MALTYVGRFLSNVKGFYDEINPATLSGAIDVIVIQQEDGTFLCSPFHVKFGKLGVIRSREKIVDMEINEEYIADLHMKLGESGEAFFVQPNHFNSQILNDIGNDFKNIKGNFTPINNILHDNITGEGPSSDYAGSIHSGDEDLATSPIWSGAEDESVAPLPTFVNSSTNLPDKVQPFNTSTGTVIHHNPSADTLNFTSTNNPLNSHTSNNKVHSSLSTGSEQDNISSTYLTDGNGACSMRRTAGPSSKTSLPAVTKKRRKNCKRSIQQPRAVDDRRALPLSTDNLEQGASSILPTPTIPPTTLTTMGVRARIIKPYYTSLESGLNHRSKIRSIENDHHIDNSSSILDLEDSSVFHHHLQPRKYSWPLTNCPIISSFSETDIIFCKQNAFLNNSIRPDALTTLVGPERHKSDTELGERKDFIPLSVKGHTCLLRNLGGDRKNDGASIRENVNSFPNHSNDQVKWKWGKLPQKTTRKSADSAFIEQQPSYNELKQASSSPPNNSSNSETKPSKTAQNVFNFTGSSSSPLRNPSLLPTTSTQPTKPAIKNVKDEGIYLDDLKGVDPQTIASYFPNYSVYPEHDVPATQNIIAEAQKEDGVQDLNGIPLSPRENSIIAAADFDDADATAPTNPTSDTETNELRERFASIPSDDYETYGSISENLNFCDISLCGFTPKSVTKPDAINDASSSVVDNNNSSIRTDESSVNNKSIISDLSNKNPFSVTVDPEAFDRGIISYEQLCNDSSIFHNPNLIVRIGKMYYPWQIAVPLIITMFVYNKAIPENCLASYVKQLPPAKRAGSAAVNKPSSAGGGSWFSWRRHHRSTQQQSTHSISSSATNSNKCPKSSTLADTTNTPNNHSSNKPFDRIGSTRSDKIDSTDKDHQIITSEDEISVKRSASFDSSQISKDTSTTKSTKFSETNPKSPTSKWIKCLRLTSEQIAKLNLREGINDVTFSVTTQFQGTTRCASHIFLWKYDDKLVISDIDGTITKSDVLGHIFPFLGKDWSQYGVAELYSRISRNGYQFVYLSSRAIGQAPGTRGYLNSFKQNNMPLPQGPILLNPNSLLSAFHKEVIEKKPEEFKISCLKDICALFPTHYHPFYAGFGNRISDVYAYRAVDIPISRIFTINYKGEISVDLTKTFLTSYTKLQDLADQVFPPVIETHRYYHQHDHSHPLSNYYEEEEPGENCEDTTHPPNQPLNNTVNENDHMMVANAADNQSITNSLSGAADLEISTKSPRRRNSWFSKPAYSFVVKSHANDALLEADKYSNFTFWRHPLPTLLPSEEVSCNRTDGDDNGRLFAPETAASLIENHSLPSPLQLQPNVITIFSDESAGTENDKTAAIITTSKGQTGKTGGAFAQLNVAVPTVNGILPTAK